MFAGHVHEQAIIADQPVIVLDGEVIVDSFSGVEEATDFLRRRRSDTAFILRHNGLNWDILPQAQSAPRFS